MDEFKNSNFPNINLPKISFDTSLLTRKFEQQQAEINASMDAVAANNRRKDAALFETAEASVAQKELLTEQLVEVKEQNQLLKDNNTTLRELYEMTKKEAESSAKEAKKSRIFGWVSLGIGTIIGIAGLIVGIII